MVSFSEEINGSQPRSGISSDANSHAGKGQTITRQGDGYEVPLDSIQVLFIAQLRYADNLYSNESDYLIGYNTSLNNDLQIMRTEERFPELAAKLSASKGNDLERAVCTYDMPIRDEEIIFTRAGLEFFTDGTDNIGDLETVLSSNRLQPFLDETGNSTCKISSADFVNGLKSASSSLDAAVTYTN